MTKVSNLQNLKDFARIGDNSFGNDLAALASVKADNKKSRKDMSIAELRADLRFILSGTLQILEHKNTSQLRDFMMKGAPSSRSKIIIRTLIPNAMFTKKDEMTGKPAFTIDPNKRDPQLPDSYPDNHAQVDSKLLQLIVDAVNLPEGTDPLSDDFKAAFPMPTKSESEKMHAQIANLRKLADKMDMKLADLVKLIKAES